MYICVTYVDAATKIPCNVAPMSTGPAYPDLQNLNIEFWNESAWPTNYPLFYGICSDDIDPQTPGIVNILTKDQYDNARDAEFAARLNLIKTKATNILSETDWTTIPDVANPEKSNPYLTNVDEFVAYRNIIRNIAINPTFDAVFPPMPQESWKI
jgi:hypothetical protein